MLTKQASKRKLLNYIFIKQLKKIQSNNLEKITHYENFIIGASGLVGSNCFNYFKTKGWDYSVLFFSYQAKNTVFRHKFKQ